MRLDRPAALAMIALAIAPPSLPADGTTPPPGVCITDVGTWVPVAWSGDVLPGSALDFSALRGTDSPAGCHGRVVVRGDHFEFEDSPGVARRFYGINLCGSANLPDKADADRLAATLARTGYNAVRFHHHDDGLVTDADGRTALDPAAMRRFDGLVAACVANGLYLTTDLYVSRRIPYRAIGIDRDGFAEINEFKELVHFHPPAYSNFLAFAGNLLTHVNEYTGRRLADEPALIGLSLVNEGALGGWQTHWAWRNPCIQEAFAVWMRDRKARFPDEYAPCYETPPPDLADLGDRQVQAYQEFLRAAERAFVRRVRAWLRDVIHCPAPLTDMNSGFYPVGHQLVRAEEHDFIDNHFYLDHPEFGPGSWGLPARVRGENYFTSAWPRAKGPENAFLRVYGKPFTVSEYNFGAPSRYRGVGGVYAGAAAALQDWSGIWRFAWSHDLETELHPESARIDYLNVVSDPLAVAGERAAVCLFLRGDVSPHATGVALDLPETGGREIEALPRLHDCTLDWNRLAWTVKVGTSVGGRMPDGIVSLGEFPEVLNSSDETLAAKAPGAGASPVSIDRKRGTFRLESSRTCAAFSENGGIRAGVLNVRPQEGIPTTVWISSLDGLDLPQSKRMLLVCLTDVQQKDAVFADADQTELLSWGGHPRMMRAAKTEIGWDAEDGEFEVWTLSSSGKRRSQIPCYLRDGICRIEADTAMDPLDATYLYEVIRR